MASNAAGRTPTELLLKIESHLPENEKHLVGGGWGRWRASKAREQHSAAWDGIFKDYTWLNAMVARGLNPVLMGCDLDKYIGTMQGKKKKTYLALVVGKDGNGKYLNTDQRDLMDCLRMSLQRCGDGGSRSELFFPETGLTLNIADPLRHEHSTTVSRTDGLVSRRLTGFHSKYLYWKDDDPQVRSIGNDKIMGVGPMEYFGSTSDMLGLEWDHIPSKKPRKHYFNRPGQEGKFDKVFNFDQRGIAGWKMSEQHREELRRQEHYRVHAHPIKTMYLGNESEEL